MDMLYIRYRQRRYVSSTSLTSLTTFPKSSITYHPTGYIHSHYPDPITMNDNLTNVRQGLLAMGVPIDYVTTLTRNLAGNDIVAVATRLALVGVLAAVLRSLISKWQNRLFESECHLDIKQCLDVDKQPSFLPLTSYPLIPRSTGFTRTWHKILTYPSRFVHIESQPVTSELHNETKINDITRMLSRTGCASARRMPVGPKMKSLLRFCLSMVRVHDWRLNTKRQTRAYPSLSTAKSSGSPGAIRDMLGHREDQKRIIYKFSMSHW